MSDHVLALTLSGTIRHDGAGGVADDLPDAAALAHWAATIGFAVPADDELVAETVALRRAVRSLFAHAIAPRPPSRADTGHVMPSQDAIALLNRAAARAPVVWQLTENAESIRISLDADPADQLLAALATGTIMLLTSPRRERLRACPAPRCCRYFVADRSNQEWCQAACGNRARVARHHRRRAASIVADGTAADTLTPGSTASDA